MEDPKRVYASSNDKSVQGVHDVSLQCLSMSFEHRMHTMNWDVHFRRSRWKSASGALNI
jgi:hypothetical protein